MVAPCFPSVIIPPSFLLPLWEGKEGVLKGLFRPASNETPTPSEGVEGVTLLQRLHPILKIRTHPLFPPAPIEGRSGKRGCVLRENRKTKSDYFGNKITALE